jgi:hypothetical protein
MRVENANRTVRRDLSFNRVRLQRAAACWLLAFANIVFSGSAAMTPRAAAQDSPYCEQAHARAASDAALLMAPRLILQELRFPRNGQVDVGQTTGQGLQFRGGLSFSVVELFKGLATLDIGDADCREHEAKVALRDRIHHARDYARVLALQAQSDYLNQHKGEWAQIGRKSAERMTRHLITLVEFTRLSQLIAGLDQKLADLEGQASILQAQLPALTHGTLAELTEDYRRQSARHEHETVSARALDAWQLRLTGGLIAQAPIDWYGQAEVSFNFGGLLRPKQELRYERARAAELAWSPDELPAQARELRNQQKIEVDQAKRELAVAQRSLSMVMGAGSVLENIEAENVQHARDVLTVERYSAESEVVFLQKLIDALASDTK